MHLLNSFKVINSDTSNIVKQRYININWFTREEQRTLQTIKDIKLFGAEINELMREDTSYIQCTFAAESDRTSNSRPEFKHCPTFPGEYSKIFPFL